MAGKKVIIRTLDIGADKQAEYLKLGKEENPAMGYPNLSETDRYIPNAAHSFAERISVWKFICDVPNDYFDRRSETNFPNRRVCKTGIGG